MTSGVQVAIAIDDAEVQAAFAELARRGADPEPLMDTIASYMESEIRLAFRGQRSPGGERWQPSKRAIMQAGSTLIDQELLLGSLSSRARGNEAVAGFQRVYAAIHNFGGKAGRGLAATLPQRRFMPESATELPELADLVANYLADVPGVSR